MHLGYVYKFMHLAINVKPHYPPPGGIGLIQFDSSAPLVGHLIVQNLQAIHLLHARIIFFSKYTGWGFDYSSCPTGRDFEFSKSQISPHLSPGRGV